MFKDRRSLAAVYPHLARHAVLGPGHPDVLRFLGPKVPAHGGVDGRFAGDVGSDLATRAEGVRVKHRVGGNSVKMYDKQGSVGSVLRVETTVNDPGGFKAYRGTEAEPGKKAWRKLRRGVADLHRRAEVSQASNDRFLSAMAAADCPATQRDAVGPVCKPVCKPVTRGGRRYRGLRPGHEQDMGLLRAVADGWWEVNGFRNADIRRELFGPDLPAGKDKDGKDKGGKGARENRGRSGKVTRQLALLHAHGLVKRVPGTRRWLVTDKGRQLATLLAAAQHASAEKRLAAAA